MTEFRIFFLSENVNIKTPLYKTVILTDFYGCETSCLALGKEHRLRVFENKMLRRIIWLKTEEVMQCYKQFYNDLHFVYSSADIIRAVKSRVLKLEGHVHSFSQ